MNSFASAELSDVAGTLLDLDFIQDSDEFDRPVEVSLADKEALMEQLFDDIEFFAANRVMDYSMLLCRGTYVGELPTGVHRLQILASASAVLAAYLLSASISICIAGFRCSFRRLDRS